ncbi:MAG: hypothetical protein GY841_15730 [FCB group bacterium]|nr:hypothetical protein [FCB group bacterium]
MNDILTEKQTGGPSDGSIEQAEKIVSQMDLRRSLERRFARFEEVPKIWVPQENKGAKSTGGVFGHLKAQGKQAHTEAPEKRCTWKWFAKEVLPEAIGIDVELCHYFRSNFSALVTSAHDDSPCIFQWKNNFSHYLYHGGSTPDDWNLHENTAKVTGISLPVHKWEGAIYNGNNSDSVLLILEGCRDLRSNSLAIFPGTLIPELRTVRKVIESYSRSKKIEGDEQATACGLMISQSSQNAGTKLIVTTKTGVAIFSIDLWE